MYKSDFFFYFLTIVLVLLLLGPPAWNCGCSATIIIRPERPDGSPWGEGGGTRPHRSLTTTPSSSDHTPASSPPSNSSTHRPPFGGHRPQLPQFPQYPGGAHVEWVPLGAILLGGGRGSG